MAKTNGKKFIKNRGRKTAKRKVIPYIKEAYRTKSGRMLIGRVEDVLDSKHLSTLRGKINLIFTSPPFPLVRKKRYGNETGQTYIRWLESLAPRLCELLTKDGSIVIEIGNSWEPGKPVMSTLGLEALLAFKKAGKLKLSQHIICHNPARLPSPAQWVNINRERLKDSFTHVWWMSRSSHPKADNRKVLLPYGEDMRALLKTKKYNSGARPSGHVISATGFLKNHGGAIAPNVISISENAPSMPEALLKFAGTSADKKYRRYCDEKGYEAHPARMQAGLASFFIQFLTDKRDCVFDPFGGSNTTGCTAETLGRKWLSVEANPEYARGSFGRFVEDQDQPQRKKMGGRNGRRK